MTPDIAGIVSESAASIVANQHLAAQIETMAQVFMDCVNFLWIVSTLAGNS
ncbi:MAG: hypothetical protein AAF197_07775 [Pseudomonadota bacterium]